MDSRVPWFAGTPQALREQKVDTGLALLDAKFGTDKVNAVDLEKLDTSDMDCCLLAQVTGKPFGHALDEVGLKAGDGAAYGFASGESHHIRRLDDHQRLTAAFRQRINARRELAERQAVAA